MAHHHVAPPTPEQTTRDLLRRTTGNAAVWIAVLVFAIVAVLGLVALASKLSGGPEPRAKWGYAAAVLAFLLSTSQAAPIVAFATRFAKGFWGIPLRRAAELHSVAGLVTTPLFILLLFQLPSFQGRPSIWFNWPGAPQLWDSIAITLLTVMGLALLWIGGLPDLAARREAGSGLARTLALGWTGTTRQWVVLTTGLIVLGAFYLAWYAFVHVFLVADLAMSLVPGWKSAVFPPYHGVSGLQAGLSLSLITLALLRKLAGLERYVGIDPFWGASKILLGTTLLFFYFTWSEFLLTWYGRTPDEQAVLGLLMFGPYMGLFVLSFSLNFIVPFLLLIWNPIRQSIGGPVLVACIVLVGNFIDRIRIYVASWSVAGPVGQHMEIDHLPATVYPLLPDVAIIVGALAAVAALYLIALRIFPPLSLWEEKTALLLRVERPYGRTEVAVVAKPR
jgi:molybdopterin-containing oxidoreductase family membrane subunit